MTLFSIYLIFLGCSCNEEGAVGNTCDDLSGKCNCRPNIAGNRCDKCAPGFYGYPDCQRNIRSCLDEMKHLYPYSVFTDKKLDESNFYLSKNKENKKFV